MFKCLSSIIHHNACNAKAAMCWDLEAWPGRILSGETCLRRLTCVNSSSNQLTMLAKRSPNNLASPGLTMESHSCVLGTVLLLHGTVVQHHVGTLNHNANTLHKRGPCGLALGLLWYVIHYCIHIPNTLLFIHREGQREE